MKIPLHKNNSGIAVIVALVAVTVLTILAGAFAYSMKVETHLAANANNDEKLLWMGRAGVQIACSKVTEGNNLPYDSLNMRWAGGPGVGPITNADPLPDPYPVGEGTVSVKIIDMERFINVNTAPPQLLQQVLTVMNVDASKISEVSDSILDWVDSDDATRPAGAESDYYQGQNPPYYAKNAPLDDISELLRIKGITKKMYDGTGQGDESDSAFHHHQMGLGHDFDHEPDYKFFLINVFKPFGSGKININTADANVLQLIPGVDQDAAEAIMKFRAGPDGQDGTEDDMPFSSPGQLAAAGVNPQAIGQIGNFVSTKSTTFEVHVTAHIADQTREFVAVIWRNGPQPQVVEFYWK